MICKKCGFELPEGVAYCNNCGEKISVEQNAGYQDGYYSSQNAQQGGYSQYPYPPVNNRPASVKDYLKWMLLYPLWGLIPGIGFIIYIVLCFKYAFDNTFPARANYFKAVLIASAIGIMVAVIFACIMFMVLGTAAFVGASVFEEVSPEFYYEFQHGFDVLRIMLGK
ncbi:MAG: zinc ribbon domain-containing protein [Clostridia bacterium]|nr:zinc ribbon domain-containing protein [Clostridia bacterium]